MDGLRQDLRFALRTLAGNPGFAGVAVVTFALGANTAIFTLMDQLLLRLLPVKAPVLDGPGPFSGSTHSHSASLAELSHPMFLEMRDKADVSAGVLRQHQPLHHPLAGAHEGGNQPGPPGVVIEPPLEDAGDFGRGSHQVRQLVQDKGERRPAVPPSDAAADRGVPQRAAPSWRTAFQWLLSVGSFDP